MIVRLSDYILEQSVSDADVFDIVVEQAQAEMKVSQAMADVYYKRIMMEMYAYDYDETFMEADTENKSFGDKVKNFFSTIWNAIINAFKWVGRQFQRFWNWLKGLFTGNKLNEKLKDTVINGSEAEVISAYDEAVEFLKSKKIKVDDLEHLYSVGFLKDVLERIENTYDQLKSNFSEILADIENEDFDELTKKFDALKKTFIYIDKGKVKGEPDKFDPTKRYNDKGEWKGWSTETSPVYTAGMDANKKREILKKMLEFSEYVGGEGRPKLNSISTKMDEITDIAFKIRKYSDRFDPNYKGKDALTADKLEMKGNKTAFVAALKNFSDRARSFTEWVYAIITISNIKLGAIQAAVIGAGKAYKDSNERSDRIKAYVDEKCESEEYQNASRDERKRLRAQYQAYAEKLYSKIDAKRADAKSKETAPGSAFGGQQPGNFSGRGNPVTANTFRDDWTPEDARKRGERDKAAARAAGYDV